MNSRYGSIYIKEVIRGKIPMQIQGMEQLWERWRPVMIPGTYTVIKNSIFSLEQ